VEDPGSEHHVIFSIEAQRVSAEAVRAATEGAEDDEGKLFADDQRAVFTACIDARREVSAGQEVELAIDHRACHFFDPATGVALDRSARPAVVA
jgi:multiple sugar transport system ATP-binding protein